MVFVVLRHHGVGARRARGSRVELRSRCAPRVVLPAALPAAQVFPGCARADRRVRRADPWWRLPSSPCPSWIGDPVGHRRGAPIFSGWSALMFLGAGVLVVLLAAIGRRERAVPGQEVGTPRSSRLGQGAQARAPGVPRPGASLPYGMARTSRNSFRKRSSSTNVVRAATVGKERKGSAWRWRIGPVTASRPWVRAPTPLAGPRRDPFLRGDQGRDPQDEAGEGRGRGSRRGDRRDLCRERRALTRQTRPGQARPDAGRRGLLLRLLLRGGVPEDDGDESNLADLGSRDWVIATVQDASALRLFGASSTRCRRSRPSSPPRRSPRSPTTSPRCATRRSHIDTALASRETGDRGWPARVSGRARRAAGGGRLYGADPRGSHRRGAASATE